MGNTGADQLPGSCYCVFCSQEKEICNEEVKANKMSTKMKRFRVFTSEVLQNESPLLSFHARGYLLKLNVYNKETRARTLRG